MNGWLSRLPEAPPLFPQDQFTDQPERFLAAELVREKAILATREEIPHAMAVLIDSFEETDKLIKIRATIYVEREGQKGILIGKGGETIKKIGTQARKELESILGTHIFLELFVKVQANWRQNQPSSAYSIGTASSSSSAKYRKRASRESLCRRDRLIRRSGPTATDRPARKAGAASGRPYDRNCEERVRG